MVDPLDFLNQKELLGFLHVHKTELSCMDNPQTFVSQLRDYSLISREQHGSIDRMKSKERIQKAVYKILDFIESKRPEHIHRFWRCAFKETILNKYPTLRLLRNSLFDGSYQSESALLEGVENNDTNVEDVPEKSEKEDVKRKRKKKASRMVDDDEDSEEPSTSSQVTPRTRKTPKKPCFSTPLKKGEKDDIWTWKLFQGQLPVMCGDLKGALNRGRLARGEKCILVDKRWYTPTEFERLAGKEKSKNWKLSIRCMNTTLGKLIEEGHLKCISYKRRSKAKKSLFPSEETTEVSSPETEDSDSESRESSSDSTEEQEEEDEGLTQLKIEARNNANRVLRVVCEDITGLLHTKRFASGTCGRSIRTESSWMTPVDFVKEASCQTDISWKKHIKCEGRPLGLLVKDNDKNDDECWVCRNEGTEVEVLVECDECPRSFHQRCHLPHVRDALLDDERPWMCTPCVFTRSLTLYSERHKDEAMASSIPDHMLHCQYLLLGLYRADESHIFKSDPLTLPEYTRVIQSPMWLDRVADKLQDKRYQIVGDFVSDIQLIFTNCATYNQDNPEFLDIGIKMKELFENEFNTVFKIKPVAS